jgi:hypothetical protein
VAQPHGLVGGLEGRDGLVREQPQCLQAGPGGQHAVARIVHPDHSHATIALHQRDDQPVMRPGVRPAAGRLRAVEELVDPEPVLRNLRRQQVAAGDLEVLAEERFQRIQRGALHHRLVGTPSRRRDRL